MRRTSSTVRIPHPTVNGMKTWSAVRSTTSTIVSRWSALAVISRKTSSSAPSWLYSAAISTGSPASRSRTNSIPFTTRPSVTSRQGMIRRVSKMSLLVAQRERVREVDRAGVERASDDRALDSDRFQSPQVLDVGDSAGRDHRYRDRRDDLGRRGVIWLGERPIALDVGVDDLGRALKNDVLGEAFCG